MEWISVENKETDMNHKNCKNCKWYENFQGVCFNGESEYCADFTDFDFVCDKWEGKSNDEE